jgi:ribosomal protein S14
MARKAMIEKSKRKPKFAVRQHNRCQRCGRSRAFLRKLVTFFVPHVRLADTMGDRNH